MKNQIRFFFILLFLFGSLFAQVPYKGEKTGNKPTAFNQRFPDIHMNESGNFILVWQAYLHPGDDDDYGIVARRFTANGDTVDSETLINLSKPNGQQYPVVTQDGLDRYWFAWQHNNTNSAIGNDIKLRRFASDFSPITGEIAVNTRDSLEQANPNIASNSNGELVVVWESQETDSSYNVYAQIYDATGAAVDTNMIVNTTIAGDQKNPHVAMDNNGFVVTWQGGITGSDWEVYAQRFDMTGAKLGTEFQVNTYTTSFQRPTGIAMNTNGRFVIVWRSDSQDGSSNGVYVRQYNNDGTARFDEILANQVTLDEQSSASVDLDSLNNFVLAWQSNLQDGDGYGIYARRFDEDGNALSDEFLVNSFTANDQRNTTTAVKNLGNFVVAWNSWLGETEGRDDVRFQMFRMGPSFTSLPDLNTTEDIDINMNTSDFFPYISDEDDSDASLTWEFFDSANLSIVDIEGDLTISPATNFNGTDSFMIVATDPIGYTDTTYQTVIVASENDLPIVTDIPDQTVDEGDSFTTIDLDDFVSDADHTDDLLNWTYSGQTDLSIAIDETTHVATITIPNVNWNGSETITFTATDPETASDSDAASFTVNSINDSPVVSNAILDQTANEDEEFDFTFAANVFTDVDIGDNLTYGATLADDSALPTWLVFTAASRNFIGTPTNAEVGTITVKVTATDDSSASVSDEFDLEVINTNDPPVLDNVILDQSGSEDDVYNFQFAANTFSDEDAGDVLTYTATLSGGAALPEWLTFTGSTRTFNGIPTNDDIGILTIEVTATDQFPASITDEFTLTINNTNDAPTVANPIADQGATQDSEFDFTFGTGVFSDVDAGDNLAYSATLADDSELPTWLTFTPATRNFNGTPSNDDVGTINIKVTATDDSSASISDEFDIVVSNENDVPVLDNPITDQIVAEDAAFDFTFAANTFSDPDLGDVLTYSASLSDDSALPEWLTFTPGTRTFNGTPLNDDVRIITVKVTATDISSASVFDEFTITVNNTNDTPTVANAIPDQLASEDILFEFIFAPDAFNDVDAGDNLAFAATLADDSALPVWLTFTAATRMFSGTPTNADTGAIDIKVTATDDASASVSDTFTLTVNNVNDAPEVSDILDQTIDEGNTFATIALDDFVTDLDNDVSEITWGTTGNTELVVTIDENRIATITSPSENWHGSETITFIATDPGEFSDSDSATFIVNAINDAPVVADILDRTTKEGSGFANINLDSFVSDVDNGDNEITWTFSGNINLSVQVDTNRILHVMPTNADWFGSEKLFFTATDPGAMSATDSATFTVTPVNDAPVIGDLPDEITFENDSSVTVPLAGLASDIDSPAESLVWSFATSDARLEIQYNHTLKSAVVSVDSAFSGDVEIYATVTDDSSATDSDTILVHVMLVTALDDIYLSIPSKYELHQNFPNPFNPTTKIRFGLPKAGSLKLEIYNIIGQKVATLYDGFKAAGYHVLEYDASQMASGIYFYRVEAGKFTSIRKMILIK